MERVYLVLDGQGRALCQGVLESSPHADLLQVRLLGDDATPLSAATSTIFSAIYRRPRGELGAEARENLRVRTNFKSVIYPVTGQWKGQRANCRFCDKACLDALTYRGSSLPGWQRPPCHAL